jgi:DeoR/GlpR family transcriptional regulator of sugar metabolism
MHTANSLKDKKKNHHIVFSYNKKNFSMHFCFNNQFIKAMRTRLIFQKIPKKYFVSLLLVSGL